MSGKGAGRLRDAAEKERKAVAAVSKLAEKALREAGQSGAANVERVRDTLQAAAVDDELRAELEAGRVTTHRAAAGLGPFALGVDTAPAPREKRGTKAKPEERKAPARAAKKPARDTKAEERARKQAEREERERRELEKRRRAELKEAQTAEKRAARRLETAERAAERARTAAE